MLGMLCQLFRFAVCETTNCAHCSTYSVLLRIYFCLNVILFVCSTDSTKGNWDGDILSCFHVPVPSALGSILVQQDGNAEIELEVSREGPIGTGAAVRTEDQAVAAAVKKKKKRLNQSQRKKSQEARMTDGDGKSVAPPAASSGTAIPVRQPFRDLKRAGVSTQNTVASQVPRTAIPQTDITRTAADGAAKSTDTTRTRSRPLQATKSSRPQFQREQQQDGSAGRDQIRMALSTPSNPT